MKVGGYLLTEETIFLFHSILLGMALTCFYDCFLVFRRLVKHNSLAISIEDLFFWLMCAVIIFIALYQENNGTLRWFSVAGAALGMLLYKKTLSIWWIRAAYFLFSKIGEIVHRVLGWIAKPIVSILKWGRKRLTSQMKMLKIGIRKK